jgi:hypothetical protein
VRTFTQLGGWQRCYEHVHLVRASALGERQLLSREPCAAHGCTLMSSHALGFRAWYSRERQHAYAAQPFDLDEHSTSEAGSRARARPTQWLRTSPSGRERYGAG